MQNFFDEKFGSFFFFMLTVILMFQWWPTDTYNGKKLFFVVLLFQFTGLTVPVLGVYKMLWTLYGSQET